MLDLFHDTAKSAKSKAKRAGRLVDAGVQRHKQATEETRMRFGQADERAANYLEQTGAFGPEAVRDKDSQSPTAPFGDFDPSVPSGRQTSRDAQLPFMETSGPDEDEFDSWFY